MLLNDLALIEEGVNGLIEPFNKNNVGPASVDLTLGSEFLFLPPETGKNLTNLKQKDDIKKYIYNDKINGEVIIGPGEFILGTTEEKVNIPAGLAAFIQGRSSIGRLGIFIENAGFIDPGFSGQITLELFNASPKKYKLETGIKICQLIVHCLKNPAHNPYNGKYQNQKGTTGSRIYKDYQRKQKKTGL